MADNKKIAEQVLAAVGGAANLKDATHCMTRLRLYLKDDNLPKDDEVKKKDDNTGRDFKVKRRKECSDSGALLCPSGGAGDCRLCGRFFLSE